MAFLSPFAEDLRVRDLARYLATLFAPERCRADLFTLYAFDSEMQRIPFLVKEPAMGEIRMQWWREVIEGNRDGEASGNPLAAAMLDLVRRHDLPVTALEHYFEAASFAFYHDAFADRQALEAWAGATHSAIVQMAALILDAHSARQAADASGHAGVADAAATIIRNLPATRSRGQCYVPEDILAACGTTREAFVAGQDRQATKRVTDAFCAFGLEHAVLAKQAIGRLQQTLKPAYIALGAARTLLQKAGKPAANPAFDETRISALSTYVAVLRGAF